MIKTLNRPVNVSRALRRGWLLLPIAGCVSFDSQLYRHAIAKPDGTVIAAICASTVKEIFGSLTAPKLMSMIGSANSIGVTQIPRQDGVVEETMEDDVKELIA